MNQNNINDILLNAKREAIRYHINQRMSEAKKVTFPNMKCTECGKRFSGTLFVKDITEEDIGNLLKRFSICTPCLKKKKKLPKRVTTEQESQKEEAPQKICPICREPIVKRGSYKGLDICLYCQTLGEKKLDSINFDLEGPPCIRCGTVYGKFNKVRKVPIRQRWKGLCLRCYYQTNYKKGVENEL